MKKLLFLFLFLIAGVLQSLGQGFANNHTRDPFNPACEEGEILIKFKNEVMANLTTTKGTISVGIPSIDEIFTRYQIGGGRKVFPASIQTNVPARMINIPAGPPVVLPSLFNIFRLKVYQCPDLPGLIRELMSDPAVEYAEPNYVITTMITEPNDALCQSGDQWYLADIGAPYAWDSVTGDTSQVVGIIDTGIDCDHPDLDGNIWINRNEIPGNGIDDDNNGYVDDAHGWDFFNNDNNPDDDNGHGTHVAGVVAAETDNYIGIAGIAWHARLMPLKVLSGTGSGNMGDLAEAINYAANNGATIINMSLGAYSESQTVKAALINAYESLCPVAAAGNDHYKTDTISPPADIYAPSFPGCYPFVVGVEATSPDGTLADFSNFDPSGFSHCWNPSGYNYEVMAPGVNIMSTFPNGGYRTLTGTSMASPVVAGAIALLKSYKPGISNAEIFARIIQFSQNGKLKIPNLLTSALNPDLLCTGQTVVDTTGNADHDGLPDAGETIEIFFTVKNAGGFADSVWTKLRLSYPGDTNCIILIDSLSFIGNLDTATNYGSIPAYTTLTGERDPFRVYIRPGVVNDKEIMLEYEIGAKHSFTKTGTFMITLQNARELCGVLDSTLSITAGKLWLVSRSFKIAVTGVLNIMPGTHLTIQKEIINKGIINSLGSADSMVTIDGNKGITDWPGLGEVHLKYSLVRSESGIFLSSVNTTMDHCIFEYCNTIIHNSQFTMTDCIFRECGDAVSWSYGTAKRCIFDNCIGYFGNGACWLYNNNFSHNPVTKSLYASENINAGFFNPKVVVSMGHNNFSAGKNVMVYRTWAYEYDTIPRHQYWGTTDSVEIDKLIYDFWDDPDLAQVLFNPILVEPTDSAHGFVWKVHLNGQNPQDGNLEPIGCGDVRFDVYFNKPMDTTRTPYLSFGVRYPHTQRVVEKNSRWSPDGKIWIAWYPIGLETGDGNNTIRVSDAYDLEGFRVATEKNERFRFVIQAASSLAIDFNATPGIGKVFLEWPFETTNDLMGFNMFRFRKINDTVTTDTLLINQTLITDSTYIDYGVSPDSIYGYCYRIVGTDNKESDFSKVAYAKPLSSANGDANGDEQVNVLDITAIISYILEQNPRPFLFEAADLNYDKKIDILDIVLLIETITNGKSKTDHFREITTPAYLDIRNDQFKISSSGNLAAIQFRIEGEKLENLELTRCFDDFEYVSTCDKSRMIGLIFSYDLRKLEAGLKTLFAYHSKTPYIKNIQIHGSDSEGNYIPVLIGSCPVDVATNEGIQIIPNPFSNGTTIFTKIPFDGNVSLSVVSLEGKEIFSTSIKSVLQGDFSFFWNGLDNNRSRIMPGIYIVKILIWNVEGKEVVATNKMVFLGQ